MAFNDLLYRFGRRHSRYLRVWFSIGIGFSLAALIGVTVIILCEMAKAPALYAGYAESGDSLFGLSFLTSGMHLSPSSMGYLCLSSFVCVMVHEFGHALAAASLPKDSTQKGKLMKFVRNGVGLSKILLTDDATCRWKIC